MYPNTVATQQPNPERDKRLSRRKPVKRGVAAQCRRGQMGLGADVAVAIVDISDCGACLVVSAEFKKGEEAELILVGVGRSKPLKVMGEIRSCVPDGEDTFRVGLRFRKRVAYAELDNFC